MVLSYHQEEKFMNNHSSLQETKHHGAVRFPFNIYPCTIPGDFRQVAVHWQDSMELIYIKRGSGLVQAGAQVYPAQSGDIFVMTPGTLHAIHQAENRTMEYENIIFDVELLGGTGDLCVEKYLLPLQSGRLALPKHIHPRRSMVFPGRLLSSGGRGSQPMQAARL